MCSGGRTELRSRWPVQEVHTHLAGQFVADLRAHLAAAGSPHPDQDLAPFIDLVRDPDDVGGSDTRFGESLDLASLILRSAYPLLTRPLDAGARPERIPVPLEALLRHDDVRTATRMFLGRRVTRPLVRAVATALLPDERGCIVWEPLHCALMAAPRCGPEQLATLLATPVHRPGAADFSIHEIDRARAMFDGTSPRRVADQLRSALTEPDGTARLAARIAAWDARPPAPARPPPAPLPRPPARRRAPSADDITYPSRWSALVGRRVGCLTVVLPATGVELVRWGAEMNNCLGAYRHVAVAGRTRIVGFRRDGRLVMAAEISREGMLRQLEGVANGAPEPALAAAAVAALRRCGVMETDGRRR